MPHASRSKRDDASAQPKKMGRPRKAEKYLSLSANIEPVLHDEIAAASVADGRAISAFGRLLLGAAWRIYRQKERKGENAHEWLTRLAGPVYTGAKS